MNTTEWSEKKIRILISKTAIRGTQREDSSKPLKYSIVERILVNGRYRHIFIPKKFSSVRIPS